MLLSKTEQPNMIPKPCSRAVASRGKVGSEAEHSHLDEDDEKLGEMILSYKLANLRKYK